MWLRRIMYATIILFFLLAAAATALFIAGALELNRQAQQVGEVVEPVTDLVRQLLVPVTPVVLPSSAGILNSINDEARLITLSANFQETFVGRRNDELLWGALGEELLFVAYGTVVAGVDLSDMTPADILVVDPQTAWVRLPPAVIFADLPILDTERSYVADRDTGLLTRADPELETTVRRVAQQEILALARDSDLLARADENARSELRQIIESLGFSQVRFFEGPFPLVTPYIQAVPKGYVVTPEP